MSNVGKGDGDPRLDQKVAHDLAAVRQSGILDYRSEALPTWCAGCGYFGIAQGITQALAAMEIDLRNLAVVSGIGCAGRFPFFMPCRWPRGSRSPGPS
ncbi:MAG: hypothetical protein JRI68_09945 [Deltaproteobacteria bacterium]|nr:hypothetical protein [Deltaproteobacteria bacterium]